MLESGQSGNMYNSGNQEAESGMKSVAGATGRTLVRIGKKHGVKIAKATVTGVKAVGKAAAAVLTPTFSGFLLILCVVFCLIACLFVSRPLTGFLSTVDGTFGTDLTDNYVNETLENSMTDMETEFAKYLETHVGNDLSIEAVKGNVIEKLKEAGYDDIDFDKLEIDGNSYKMDGVTINVSSNASNTIIAASVAAQMQSIDGALAVFDAELADTLEADDKLTTYEKSEYSLISSNDSTAAMRVFKTAVKDIVSNSLQTMVISPTAVSNPGQVITQESFDQEISARLKRAGAKDANGDGIITKSDVFDSLGETDTYTRISREVLLENGFKLDEETGAMTPSSYTKYNDIQVTITVSPNLSRYKASEIKKCKQAMAESYSDAEVAKYIAEHEDVSEEKARTALAESDFSTVQNTYFKSYMNIHGIDAYVPMAGSGIQIDGGGLIEFDGSTQEGVTLSATAADAFWQNAFAFASSNGIGLVAGNPRQCVLFAEYMSYLYYGTTFIQGNGNQTARSAAETYPNIYQLSDQPAPGSILSVTSGDVVSDTTYGHVMFVLKVEGDYMWTADGNIWVDGMEGGVRFNTKWNISDFLARNQCTFAVPVSSASTTVTDSGISIGEQ